MNSGVQHATTAVWEGKIEVTDVHKRMVYGKKRKLTGTIPQRLKSLCKPAGHSTVGEINVESSLIPAATINKEHLVSDDYINLQQQSQCAPQLFLQSD